jgi:hypothetical protein
MSLASALEIAAAALPDAEPAIRPANGDPERLLDGLPAAEAPKLLAWLLENELEAGEELLSEWIESDRGAEAVLATPDAHLPKPARKALRRARHHLRGRGLVVEAAEPSSTVSRLPTVKDDLETAAVSSLDPLGACLVYLVERNPSGGARLFELALAERRGLFDARVYSAGRSKVRGFLREVTGRDGMQAVAADPDAVRSLIARAAAAHPADRPVPPDFRDWRGHLTGDASAVTPAEQVAAALEPGPPGKVETVLVRIAAGLLGPWAQGEVLQRAAERLGELGESRIIVSPAQRQAQAEEILSEALDEAYAGEGGRAAAACFAHTAYVAWRRGEEEEARELLAAGATFAAGSPAQNAVARALLERPLRGVLEKLGEEQQEGEDSRLIVTPGEPAGSARR